MDNTTKTARPMHTVTFQAASGYQETYHCFSWQEFHTVCQALEARGFRRVAWIDRS